MPKDEANEIMILLEQVQKLLDDLIKYRKTLEATINAMESKIGSMERRVIKVENEKATGVTQEMEEVINIHSESIKENSKDLEMMSQAIEDTRKQLAIQNTDTERKYKDNLKFEESIYVELKEIEKESDDKLKSMEKELAKMGKEVETANRLKNAIAEVIKAVTE